MIVAGQERWQNRLEELNAHFSQGFSIVETTAGDVIIHNNGHVYGVWCAGNGTFNYFPSGHREPTHTFSDLGDVVELTLQQFVGRFDA